MPPASHPVKPMRPGDSENPENVAAIPVIVSGRPKAAEEMVKIRWQVLVMLFMVLGPLALPLLWRSPRFSRPWKMVLTVLVVIQTVVVIWLLWYTVNWFLGELRTLRSSEIFH